jgi:hypothetical protein
MPLDPRVILKTYFETGDVPTEAQFENLIDSFLRVEVGFGNSLDGHFLALDSQTGGILQNSLGEGVLLSEGELISDALRPGEAYSPFVGVGLGSSSEGPDLLNNVLSWACR